MRKRYSSHERYHTYDLVTSFSSACLGHEGYPNRTWIWHNDRPSAVSERVTYLEKEQNEVVYMRHTIWLINSILVKNLLFIGQKLWVSHLTRWRNWGRVRMLTLFRTPGCCCWFGRSLAPTHFNWRTHLLSFESRTWNNKLAQSV